MEFPLFIVIADKMNCLFRESTNDWEAIFLHNDIWLECSSKVCLYTSYMQQSFFLREVLNGISVRKDRQQNCKVSTKKLNN